MSFVRQLHLCRGRASLSFSLANQGSLQFAFRPGILQPRFRGLHIGRRLGEMCAIVPVVDAELHVPCLNALVILDFHCSDIARHLGRQRGEIATDIGVVGRGLVATDHQPATGQRQDRADAEQQADQLALPGGSLTGLIRGSGDRVLERVHFRCPV
ncbi:hypothetical protein D3C85_655930 [compost metagenome]